MSTAERNQVTYWSVLDEILPDAARAPWDAVGGGGQLVAGGVRVSSTATRRGYRRLLTDTRLSDRIEVQVTFKGATNNPTWSTGSPGHILSIDDGHRAVGLAIGATLQIVDPANGAHLVEIPAAAQPGGWLRSTGYHVIKDGSSTFDFYVDGNLVFRLPYFAGATSALSSSPASAALEFGWRDTTALAAGDGTWDRIESGVNEVLPPHWKVDRARSSMGGPLQQEWTSRHEGFLRATVGLAHRTQDAEARARALFTAQVLPVQRGAFSGALSPAAEGWTLDGTGTWSTVRVRQRIAAGDDDTFATWTWVTPVQTDAVFYGAARFTTRSWNTLDPTGRIGPFLVVRDGNRQIGVVLRRDLDNQDAVGWQLTDADTDAADLGNTGDVVYRVDPRSTSFVELYVIGRDRVLLFVDGDIVEDVPYSRFTTVATDFDVRIGRVGVADGVQAEVDIEDGAADIRYGDKARRSEFLRRVAERMLFASGCERNDRLDAWMRHRPGIFAARGTDRVLSEVRRLACDDDAELISTLYPANWYIGVTYPGVTPTFLGDVGDILDAVYEYRIDAPNFTADQLTDLVVRYLIPQSAIEYRFAGSLITDLTGSTGPVTVGGETFTQFTVESTEGFAAGDDVTLRQWTADTLLSIAYDNGAGNVDAIVAGVQNGRVYAEWSATLGGGAGTGATNIGGRISVTGKDADKLANVTAGGTIKLKGAGAGVNVWAEVYGIQTTTGLPIMRRYHVVGTADVVDSTTLWAEVHGVITDVAAQAAVSVIDMTSVATLYTVALGARTSGAYLFDPPFLGFPGVLTVTPDGATTAKMVVWGVEENQDETGAKIQLAGTTPVATSTSFATCRVLAVGYVAAARALAITRLANPGASGLQLNSSSASDTQAGRLYLLTTAGVPYAVDFTLNGTSNVGLAYLSVWHVLGIELFAVAVGTVTLKMIGASGAPDVTVTTLAPGARVRGVRTVSLEVDGTITVALTQSPATRPWFAIYGTDPDGAPQIDAIQMVGGDARQRTSSSWTRALAMVDGGIEGGSDVFVAATAWRFARANDAISALADWPLWSVAGPTGGQLALDGELDDAVAVDVAGGAVDFSGRYSVAESTVIASIGSATQVRTESITGSFTAGAVLRKN